MMKNLDYNEEEVKIMIGKINHGHKKGDKILYSAGSFNEYITAETDYHAKTEDDRQSSYELGLSEAWEAARKIVEYGRIKCDVILGDGVVPIENRVDPFIRLTAAEAISKIKAYEEKKQEEIKVGDEVILNGYYSPAIIIMNNGSNRHPYNVIFADGDTLSIDRDVIDRKTGRTFPQIAEVLKKMQEGE